MLYLLDANVLIDADRDYYPLDAVPEFWEWLIHHANEDHVKMCIEVYEEVTAGNGDLVDWLKQKPVKKALLLDEESDPNVVNHVVVNGYGADLTDIQIVAIGRDPFLIAHALADIENRRVVTTEVSAPSKTRHNRKVPDVCDDFKVKWCDKYRFPKELNFRTKWNA